MSLPIVQLGEIAKFINGDRGKNYPSKTSLTDSGIPFINAGHLLNGSIDMNIMNFISEQQYNRLGSGKVQNGDILYCLRGSLGKTAIVNKLDKGAIASSLAIIRTGTKLLTKYLYYFLTSSRGQSLIKQYDNGSSQPNLSAASVKKYEIPLPPIDEQRRIAAILDKADAVRRKRQEAIRLSEELLRSAFLEMFGDPVTNPKGWETIPLGKCCSITTGNTPPRSNPNYYGDQIEWIKSDNVNTADHLLTQATEYLSKSGMSIGRTADKGSVLMTCIAGSRSSIGKVAIVDHKVAFNQQINALTSQSTVDSKFLYVLLLLAKRLVQAVSTDGMKGLVSKGRLAKVEVPIPPVPLQQQFARIFDQSLQTKHHSDDAFDKSQDLFNSLVQRAFRGDL